MLELISYCIIGGCLPWTVDLVLYLCVESANDVAYASYCGEVDD